MRLLLILMRKYMVEVEKHNLLAKDKSRHGRKYSIELNLSANEGLIIKKKN